MLTLDEDYTKSLEAFLEVETKIGSNRLEIHTLADVDPLVNDIQIHISVPLQDGYFDAVMKYLHQISMKYAEQVRQDAEVINPYHIV